MSHRRYISEVRFGAERPAVTLFGNRTIYDHWAQIEPACGQILLPPQWRPAQARVSFTWQQPGGDAPLSGRDLSELRAALNTLAKQLPQFSPADAARPLAGLSVEQIGQVALAKTGEIIRRFAAKPDAQLSTFACRTPSGPRLHSWGADIAAHPLLLETPKQDILGQLVIEGGEHLTGEILLQSTRGATLERAQPDSAGHFTFTSVDQGLYRIRPVYPEVFFATPDVSVSVTRDEPTEVTLRGTWRRAPSAALLAAELKRRQQRKQRWRRLLLALLLLLLLGAAGRSVWMKSSSHSTNPPTKEITAAKNPAKTPDALHASPRVAADKKEISSSTTVPAKDSPMPAVGAMPASDKHNGMSAQSEVSPATQGIASTSSSPGENAQANDSAGASASNVSSEQSAAAADPRSADGTPGTSAESPSAKSGPTPDAQPPDTPSIRVSDPRAPASPRAGGGRSTPDVSLVISGGSEVPSGSAKSSAALPTNQPNPDAFVQAPATDATPSTTTTMAGSPIQPAPSAGNPDTPSLPALPAQPAPARAVNSQIKITAATGTGAPMDSNPTTAIGLLLPEATAAHTNGTTKLIPVADSGTGPGKAAAPIGSSEFARPTGQIQLPGSDRSGSQIQSASVPGGGGTNNGTIIGGVAILGSPGVGSPQTAGENENATHETHVTNVGPQTSRSVADAAPVTELGRETGAAPQSASVPSPSIATPSSIIKSSIINPPTYAQPKTVVLHLGWELRLNEDLIAPEMTPLRDRLLATNQLKMPRTLRDRQTEGGFVIVLPPGIEVRPPVWRDATNTKAGHTSVSGNRAEFSWTGNQLPKGADYALESREGELWARVTVDKNGVASVSVAPGALRSYWVGVLRSTEDDSLLSPADWTQRLQWRTSGGKTLPPAWHRDATWRNGRGYRVEISLDEPAGNPVSRDIGLVDILTGWVLSNPFTPPVVDPHSGSTPPAP